MAVLLDTATLAAGDRSESFRSAMVEVSGSTRVELEEQPGGVAARMELWQLGTADIFASESTGVSMVRDARAARGASPEAVAVAVQGVGQGRHETGSRQRIVRTGDVMVVDITRPFDFGWTGRGSSTSFRVPIAELGLPLDAVQRAAGRLASSPLYDIVGRHLVDLTRQADKLSASSTAPALGASSTQLVRALLAGADEDDSRLPEVIEETLITQVLACVRQNLRDPALGPESIANALAVSRRQLFRVCQQADLSLEQYVIDRRLAGAKAELAAPLNHSRTIAAVAAWWGFKDATHFGRRFKAAYGMLPRDWRRLTTETRASGQ
ncbi:MAG: hypothetical protein JWR85_446 [Marmoricola sp.]|nr:hypothetical protein [Marmoricola sp.]